VNEISLIDALAETKLCPSKSEARRMIEGGGIYLNDDKITDTKRVLADADFEAGYALLRKGKKSYMKIVCK